LGDHRSPPRFFRIIISSHEAFLSPDYVIFLRSLIPDSSSFGLFYSPPPGGTQIPFPLTPNCTPHSSRLPLELPKTPARLNFPEVVESLVPGRELQLRPGENWLSPPFTLNIPFRSLILPSSFFPKLIFLTVNNMVSVIVYASPLVSHQKALIPRALRTARPPG